MKYSLVCVSRYGLENTFYFINYRLNELISAKQNRPGLHLDPHYYRASALYTIPELTHAQTDERTDVITLSRQVIFFND